MTCCYSVSVVSLLDQKTVRQHYCTWWEDGANKQSQLDVLLSLPVETVDIDQHVRRWGWGCSWVCSRSKFGRFISLCELDLWGLGGGWGTPSLQVLHLSTIRLVVIGDPGNHVGVVCELEVAIMEEPCERVQQGAQLRALRCSGVVKEDERSLMLRCPDW